MKQPKYNIGDRVYTIQISKIISGLVCGVQVGLEGGAPGSLLAGYVRYTIAGEGKFPGEGGGIFFPPF